MSKNTTYLFQARLIDFFIIIICSSITYFTIQEQSTFNTGLASINIVYFIQAYYLLLLIVSMSSTKGRTFGDVVTKVNQRYVNGKECSLFRIIVKEIYFFVIVFLFNYNEYGIIFTILNLLPLVKFKNSAGGYTFIEFIFKISHFKLAGKE